MNTSLTAKRGMRYKTDDLHISKIKEVSTPAELHKELPLTDNAARLIQETRADIHAILHGEDDRVLVVTGPCSIHDPKAAREYAERLLPLRERLRDDLLIVMRVYFEKPRTTVGWKGLVNDPDLDGSFHINKGLRLARGLLLDLAERGMPAGTEYLDPISPQYVSDVISWGAIGARTTESQVHRELASGLSCPIGFKNGTSGNLQIAIDAIGSATHGHHFLGLTKSGKSAIFSTTGNPDCHLILRGGKSEPNYDAEHVAEAIAMLDKAQLKPSIMIDYSHANSRKQHDRQTEVGEAVAAQIAAGQKAISGVMIESHLVAGRQNVVEGQDLIYGQSITDACISWEQTVPLLEQLAAAVRERR